MASIMSSSGGLEAMLSRSAHCFQPEQAEPTSRHRLIPPLDRVVRYLRGFLSGRMGGVGRGWEESREPGFSGTRCNQRKQI